jgi:hypothetical protein
LLLILVIDFGRKVQKCFFDPITLLATDLEVLHFMFVGKPLRLITVDLLIIAQITLSPMKTRTAPGAVFFSKSVIQNLQASKLSAFFYQNK